MFYTYLHRRNDTGQVFYVGKGKGNRLTWSHGRSGHWNHVVDKHGYTAEICAHWENESDAMSHEKLLVSIFRDLGEPLVNHTDGGEGVSGHIHSAESRLKQSNSAKNRVVSSSTRAKLSAALVVRFGRPHEKAAASLRAIISNARPDVKEKISASSKASWQDPAYRAKRSASMAPISASQEYRDKISRGNIEANKIPGVKERRAAGIVRWYEQPGNREAHGAARKIANNKPETIAKISAASRTSHARPEVKKKISEASLTAWKDPASRAKRSKRVICVETGIEYSSQVVAAAATGEKQSNISKSCLMGWATHGWHFAFLDPQNPKPRKRRASIEGLSLAPVVPSLQPESLLEPL